MIVGNLARLFWAVLVGLCFGPALLGSDWLGLGWLGSELLVSGLPGPELTRGLGWR